MEKVDIFTYICSHHKLIYSTTAIEISFINKTYRVIVSGSRLVHLQVPVWPIISNLQIK